MKVDVRLEKLPAKIGLLLLGIGICSCNALKRVDRDEWLLTDYTILADSVKITDPDINSLVLQKPNSKVLGLPLRLHLFNLAKKNPDSSFQAWLDRKPKRKERLDRLLSKKQADRLGESFLVSGYSQWLKRIGEAPVVIDSGRTEKTVQRLSAFYDSKGYFDNTGTYALDSTGSKRAGITYRLDLGDPYIVDTLSRRIASPALDSLYLLHRKRSLVKEGDPFDLDNFTRERQRLTSLFRNSGIWNFQESSITYDILRDTLNRDDQQMEVELNIQNLRSRGDTLNSPTEYRVHRMGAVNVYADYDFQYTSDDLESVTHGNYRIFYKDRLRYKPRALIDAVFLHRDSVYRDIDRLRTYRQISSLNTFRYPTIELLPNAGDRLDANIYLTARPRNSLSLDFDLTHSNIQRVGVGGGASLNTRNVFGGAETLSLSGRGSFGLLSDEVGGENFFTEIRGDINLTFPRLWIPFVKSVRLIPNYMLPQTRVTVGTSLQKNLGLDKKTFNTILGYSWSPSDTKKNLFELINVQFVRNVNPDRFYHVYRSSYSNLDNIADDYQDIPALQAYFEPSGDPADPLRLSIPYGAILFTYEMLINQLAPPDSQDYRNVFRIEERRQRLIENNLIFNTNYTFTKNSKTDINDKSFYQIRWRLETAGNLLSGLSGLIPFNQSDDGRKLVFGVPYSQYVKTELEYIRHWEVTPTDVLAIRAFGGIAVPFGNSGDIPFVRSYFAGGSNDNRAWFPYSLGPGSTQNLNDFNEANFKLSFNVEYRFPVVGDLKGALFSDIGNIWNVWDSQQDPAAVFKGFRSLEDIAWGTGFGLRYDFNYFVFRADLGFKTYNPAENPGKRWFRTYNFANSVLQIGINYPF